MTGGLFRRPIRRHSRFRGNPRPAYYTPWKHSRGLDLPGYENRPTPPPFRRRPESRTPVCPELRKGRGVDSRFRGNDGMGREYRDGAGMTMGLGGVIWRWRAQCDSPSPNPLPMGEGFLGACAFTRLGGFIRRWLPYIVGAHGRAPLPRITKPALYHETRPKPLPRNPICCQRKALSQRERVG